MSIDAIGLQPNIAQKQQTGTHSSSGNAVLIFEAKSGINTVLNDCVDTTCDIKKFSKFGEKYDNKAQDEYIKRADSIRKEYQKLIQKHQNMNMNLTSCLPEPPVESFASGKEGFKLYKDALKGWEILCREKFEQIDKMLGTISPDNNCIVTIGDNNKVLVQIPSSDNVKSGVSPDSADRQKISTPKSEEVNFSKFGEQYEKKAQNKREKRVDEVQKEYRKLLEKHDNVNFDLETSLPEPSVQNFDDGKDGYNSYKTAVKIWKKDCQTKFKQMDKMLDHVESQSSCVVTIGDDNNILVHIPSKTGTETPKPVETSSNEVSVNITGQNNRIAVLNTGRAADGTNSSQAEDLHVDNQDNRIITVEQNGAKNNAQIIMGDTSVENSESGKVSVLGNGNFNDGANFNPDSAEPENTAQVLAGDLALKNEDGKISVAGNDNFNRNVSGRLQIVHETQIIAGKIDAVNENGDIAVGGSGNFNQNTKTGNEDKDFAISPTDCDSSQKAEDKKKLTDSVNIDGAGNRVAIVTQSAGSENSHQVVMGDVSVRNSGSGSISAVGNENFNSGDISPAKTSSQVVFGDIKISNEDDGQVSVAGRSNYVSTPESDSFTGKSETGVLQENKIHQYKVKKGDYWYNVVAEQYGLSSGSEIMKIVRHLKDEYFEENKKDLTKQGYNNSKDGFFPKSGGVLQLPDSIEIEGIKYKLKTAE